MILQNKIVKITIFKKVEMGDQETNKRKILI